MCKLCDRIYTVTESLPELTDCIGTDFEGVLELMTVQYNPHLDSFYHTSFVISYCPECGKKLIK